jgi:hypothetical protein
MFKSASLRPFGALEKGSQVSWPGCGRSKYSALGRPPRAVWIRLALPMLANAHLLQASKHGNDALTIEPSAAHRPPGGLLLWQVLLHFAAITLKAAREGAR